jgi:hypothetical protein
VWRRRRRSRSEKKEGEDGEEEVYEHKGSVDTAIAITSSCLMRVSFTVSLQI